MTRDIGVSKLSLMEVGPKDGGNMGHIPMPMFDEDVAGLIPCEQDAMCEACAANGGCDGACSTLRAEAVLRAEEEHRAVMAEADAAITGARVAMAEADAILTDAALDLDPDYDWPPVDDDFDGPDSRPRATTFDDGWAAQDPYGFEDDFEREFTGGPSMNYMPPRDEQIERRNGTIFLADIGDGIVDWRDLRPVKSRKQPSNWTRRGNAVLLRRRIRQLAKSWVCSEEEAADRFFGHKFNRLGRRIDLSHLLPRHAFPVRRTRQFED